MVKKLVSFEVGTENTKFLIKQKKPLSSFSARFFIATVFQNAHWNFIEIKPEIF